MITLKIRNPFNAPVYHEKIVGSTMDVSRQLALKGEPHGTVITADFQEEGRGRVQGRKWQMETKINLPFTVLLRYPRFEDIPVSLTLRTGLAVSLAIEDFALELKDMVMVKWPNDIIINSKKAAGILCEAVTQAGPQTSFFDSGIVHIGIGINFAQKEFPPSIKDKATSITLAVNRDIAQDERFSLLEMILVRLYDELETMKEKNNWKSRLEQRLYKRGEQVVFIEGIPGREINGRLSGIGESGELLIAPDGESEVRSFISGELKYT
jgi:BirA family biotin operon repressor/biotin-[acetyl-CoA-carboxylase] ligase